MSKIIVGIDESPAAALALRWAADYARLTGCSVHAIHVAELPNRLIRDESDSASSLNDAIQLSDDYRRRIHKIWDGVGPGPSWRLEIYRGTPGPVLAAKSADAELLVVGTHLHVGLGRIFPGSVSHYCLTHCQVPVIAVPAPAPTAGAKIVERPASTPAAATPAAE